MIKTIIDGYNVIFECGLEDRFADALQMERARHRLLRDISRQIAEGCRAEMLVVFDAKDRPRKDLPDQLRFRGLHVRFATEFPDADAYIEAFLARHSAPKQLLVVSSDHRVQTAAKRRKAKFQDSDDWWTWLENQILVDKNELNNEVELSVSSDEVDWYDQLGGKSLEQDVNAIIRESVANELNEAIQKQRLDEPSNERRGVKNKTARESLKAIDQKQAELERLDLDGVNPFPPGYADDLFEET